MWTWRRPSRPAAPPSVRWSPISTRTPSVRVMLVEKTDRLYRNLKDWVTLDELDVEVHFPKEGVVLSRESRSSEKFMHGIKVLMAKNYIDNLSEETRTMCCAPEPALRRILESIRGLDFAA